MGRRVSSSNAKMKLTEGHWLLIRASFVGINHTVMFERSSLVWGGIISYASDNLLCGLHTSFTRD